MIQTFTLLLQDSEFEVKLAAINNITDCLKYVSTNKINELLLPTIMNSYADGTPQFKAGAASALCNMASLCGKDYSVQKILPILLELIKDDNSEVKQNVVEGMIEVCTVVGIDNLQ